MIFFSENVTLWVDNIPIWGHIEFIREGDTDMTDFVKALLEKAVMEIANQTDAAWHNELTRIGASRSL
jgi:hypothetical protein